MISSAEYLSDLYLDWFNNFLSVECFAEYHGLEPDEAKQLIALAKTVYERRVKYLPE